MREETILTSSRLTMFFVILSMTPLTLFCVATSEDSKYSANAQNQYETLYFQSQMTELTRYYLDNSKYTAWTMNTDTSSGQVMHSTLNFGLLFVSPPLAEQFTFQGVGIKVYHQEALSGRDNYFLDWTIGAIDASGVKVDYGSGYYTMNWGSNVSMIDAWRFSDVTLLKGERLFIRLSLETSSGSCIDMYWGNSSFPSQVSYNGTAVYAIPEFPLPLLFPMLMMAALLALVCRKQSWHTKASCQAEK